MAALDHTRNNIVVPEADRPLRQSRIDSAARPSVVATSIARSSIPSRAPSARLRRTGQAALRLGEEAHTEGAITGR